MRANGICFPQMHKRSSWNFSPHQSPYSATGNALIHFTWHFANIRCVISPPNWGNGEKPSGELVHPSVLRDTEQPGISQDAFQQDGFQPGLFHTGISSWVLCPGRLSDASLVFGAGLERSTLQAI